MIRLNRSKLIGKELTNEERGESGETGSELAANRILIQRVMAFRCKTPLHPLGPYLQGVGRN
jgi:hypothetical protein